MTSQKPDYELIVIGSLLEWGVHPATGGNWQTYDGTPIPIITPDLLKYDISLAVLELINRSLTTFGSFPPWDPETSQPYTIFLNEKLSANDLNLLKRYAAISPLYIEFYATKLRQQRTIEQIQLIHNSLTQLIDAYFKELNKLDAGYNNTANIDQLETIINNIILKLSHIIKLIDKLRSKPKPLTIEEIKKALQDSTGG